MKAKTFASFTHALIWAKKFAYEHLLPCHFWKVEPTAGGYGVAIRFKSSGTLAGFVTA